MQYTAATPENPANITNAPTLDIQLLVIDLDGTVVDESNEIRESVKQAIQAVQAKGIPVGIATGRMFRSALRFHQDIGSTVPLICYQGALIKDPATQKVHHHLPISVTTARELLDVFEQPEWNSRLSVHFYIEDQLYVREISRDSKNYSSRSRIQPIPVGDLRQTLHQEPTKVLALSDDPSLIDQLLNQLRHRYTPQQLYLTKSVPTFLEATHPWVNKGAAVRYVAEELLGLDAANVMTLGDNFNDVEMLMYAGMGVAMGNAPDEVKAIAQWVAPTIEEDGAVAAIEAFLL